MPDEKFNLPVTELKNLNTTKADESDKTIIGAGKSLMDLRKDAALSVVKKDNPIIKSVQSNQSDPNTSESIQTKINHSENLIKLLSNSFSNHRERINAEKKIRSYFDGLK